MEIEKTENKFSFISPYWSPYTIIKWLCAKSIPEKKKVVLMRQQGYCFFQNKRGYNFLSYDSFTRSGSHQEIGIGHEPKKVKIQRKIRISYLLINLTSHIKF